MQTQHLLRHTRRSVRPATGLGAAAGGATALAVGRILISRALLIPHVFHGVPVQTLE
jgi:hypothetical protein